MCAVNGDEDLPRAWERARRMRRGPYQATKICCCGNSPIPTNVANGEASPGGNVGYGETQRFGDTFKIKYVALG